MNCTEDIPKTVDAISTIKDIIIILLSAIAILSSYFLHKKTQRAEWIKDFRSIAAKLVSTIITQIEKDDMEYHKNVFEQFSLVALYLDENNSLHVSLLDDLQTLKSDLKEFDEGKKTSAEVSVTIASFITTTKKIIEAENKKIF